MFTREELDKIAALVKKHNVVVIADEVYEWLVYEGGPKMIRFGKLRSHLWSVSPKTVIRPSIIIFQPVYQICGIER